MVPVPIVGPIIGAVFGGFLYERVLKQQLAVESKPKALILAKAKKEF